MTTAESTPVEPLPTARFATALFVVTGGLLLMDLTLQLLAPEQDNWQVTIDSFNVTREADVPTFWNASLLVLLSAACASVVVLTSRTRVGWAVVAAASALLVWTWTSRLPRRVRIGLRTALLLYGLGAIVVEGLSGVVDQQLGVGLVYRFATLLEEGLEMSACVVAIVTALRMLASGGSTVTGRSSCRWRPKSVARSAARGDQRLVARLFSRRSTKADWALTSFSRAVTGSSHAARSISGNCCSRPDLGGHSTSKVPGTNVSGSMSGASTA